LNAIAFHEKSYLLPTTTFLSRVSMQCMQNAILFYHFCPSVRLSIPVLCLNEYFLTVWSGHHSSLSPSCPYIHSSVRYVCSADSNSL